ncbi:MAG TPA: alpha/beta hydrolase [Candidatus Cybelea sp.]|nr:alpha/beta hydrolase [Candidatus Cybelea sp.]
MNTIALILVILLAFYFGVLALLYATQRKIVFAADATRADLMAAGLAEQMTEVTIEPEPGLKLVSWWAPAVRPDRRVIAYFHGNAGHHGSRADRIPDYLAAGYGVLLIGYRGYGGNPGQPTEQGLYADARANLAFLARENVRPHEIVLFGESLGTAVAIQMATEFPALALVLEAPLASILLSARARYPLFAFGPLVKDKFASIDKIAKVKMPVLVLHGELDRVTAVKFGRMIFAAANDPKHGIFPPSAGHTDLMEHGMAKEVLAFLDRLPSVPASFVEAGDRSSA